MPFSKGPTYAIATSDNAPHNKFPIINQWSLQQFFYPPRF
jgi:hypothetical protein